MVEPACWRPIPGVPETPVDVPHLVEKAAHPLLDLAVEPKEGTSSTVDDVVYRFGCGHWPVRRSWGACGRPDAI